MNSSLEKGDRAEGHGKASALLPFGFFLLLGLAACQTPKYQPVPDPGAKPGQPAPVILREGDGLTFTFPGATNLNTTLRIGREGKITMPQIGEVVAAGKTVGELEKELVERYAGKLVSNNFNITVQSSSYSVYVTGAVLRPGKLTTDRTMTALEAVMEAGVDHSRANLKNVKVTRITGGRTEHFLLNLKEFIDGSGSGVPFYLEPGDIVYVPEKFSLF